MRLLILLAMAALAMLMTACVPSLQPLYTERDLVLDPRLPGIWTSADGTVTWIFQRPHGPAYKLIEVEHGVEKKRRAHLLHLGGYFYLDTYPETEASSSEAAADHHQISVHHFYRIRIGEHVLQIAMLNDNWLAERLDQEEDLLDHVLTDGRLILTAPTERLQAFIMKHAENPEAFTAWSLMYRLAGDPEASGWIRPAVPADLERDGSLTSDGSAEAYRGRADHTIRTPCGEGWVSRTDDKRPAATPVGSVSRPPGAYAAPSAMGGAAVAADPPGPTKTASRPFAARAYPTEWALRMLLFLAGGVAGGFLVRPKKARPANRLIS